MSAAQYFEEQLPEHRELYFQLHRLILDSHPGIRSLIKYRVPFYVLKKNLCYLCTQKNQPVLGIVEGYRLSSVHHLLDFTGRTQIGHFDLKNLNENRYAELISVLNAAIAHDLDT